MQIVNKFVNIIHSDVSNFILLLQIISNDDKILINKLDILEGEGLVKALKIKINVIWDKYYKNEKNHQRNKIGTGLGLSICKTILVKHNWNYGVESKKGKGTIFYFDIKKQDVNSPKNH